MKKLLLLYFCCTALAFSQDAYRMFINRINLPFNNSGLIADVIVNGELGGELDGIQFLYRGGFLLAGKNADTIWANGVRWTADYQAGNVDSIPYNPKYGIYDVEDFNAFSYDWQKYRYAVEIGADFYDGDGDGIYNPVDLNGNNQWDPYEDKPDIFQESLTTWCVYNDGVPTPLRQFENEYPLGIEIHQTLFSYGGLNDYDARKSSFFVRYKIINTGNVNNVFDSVYFGIWADTDLGGFDGYIDDLASCDTAQNSGFIYNDGDDPNWGANPPVHFIKFLQGPSAYIPGETFIDNNLNGVYDEGIDTPLDSAYNFKGHWLGIDTIPGAKNLGLTSFYAYPRTMVNTEPGNSVEALNSLMGLQLNGEEFDPCTWSLGQVLGGADCDSVNPVYMYSGNPITQYGWINIFVSDYRQLPSTGPFRLEVGKPVTIIVAHIVGRGTDNLNSITVSRNYSEAIQTFYESNFTNIPVSVDDDIAESIPSSFHLFQNYPNPFNPSTIIRYQLPATNKVSLKVYDILGREIATLVNEEKPAGTHEIVFDASSLSSGISAKGGYASGVYFYEIQTGDFRQTKKMILLR